MNSIQNFFINRGEKELQGFLSLSKEMGISDTELSKIQLFYNFESREISPAVGYDPTMDKILLKIPLFFMIEKKDITENSDNLDYAIKKIFPQPISKKTKNAFSNFLSNEKQLKDLKRFVLRHEIAHILYGDIYQKARTPTESIEREKRADLTACAFEKSMSGALYLFNLMQKAGLSESSDGHPPISQRIQYISQLTQKIDNHVTAIIQPNKENVPVELPVRA